MSNVSAKDISSALLAALPMGVTPQSIVVDRQKKAWQLSIQSSAICTAEDLEVWSKRLTDIAATFTIEVVQAVVPPAAAEEAPLSTEEAAWDDDTYDLWPDFEGETALTSDAPFVENTIPVHVSLVEVSPVADAIGTVERDETHSEGLLVQPDVVHTEEAPAEFLAVLGMPVMHEEASASLTAGEADDITLLCQQMEAQEHAIQQERAQRQTVSVASLATTKSAKSDVFYGRKFEAAPVPLLEITEDRSGKIAVCGRVFSLDTFVSRQSGQTFYSFDITDMTDSITVRVLPGEGRGNRGRSVGRNQGDYGSVSRAETPTHRLNDIAVGQWVSVLGTLGFDRPEAGGDIQIIADSIIACPPPPEREDTAGSGHTRVELHAHTNMSSMDALPSAESLVRLAARYQHPAIAITDHGVLQSFPEAMNAGKKYGIKILYGCEIYLVDSPDDKHYYHLTVLVKNMQGLRALYDLTTEAHLNYFYRRPRIPREMLQQKREHLLLGTACGAGEVYRALTDGYLEDFPAAIAKAKELAGFYDYIEVMPLGHMEFLIANQTVPDRDALIAINQAMIAIAAELGLPAVATSDVHFLHPEDAIYRDVLQGGQEYESGDAPCLLHLRTTEEMLAEFDYLAPEEAKRIVVDNSRAIADSIEAIKPIPDKLFAPTLENSDGLLRDITTSTAKQLYGDPIPEIVSARLERELECIIGYGYAVTYIIAHRLIQQSMNDGYLVGSRGSVGSSLAATFANITEVNPLPAHYRCPQCQHSDFSLSKEYACGIDLPDCHCPHCGTEMVKDGFDIAFETFLGFEGDKVPDIDLNFSGEYHTEAHRQCEELLGKENVFRAGTISTIAEKTAFGFALKYLEKHMLTKRKVEVSRLAQGLLGVKRTTGQHPGGLIVVPSDMHLHDFTPAQRPADDRKSGITTTHFDFNAIHDCLLKLDLLGHDDPTILRYLQQYTGIDVRSVDIGDERVLSLFTDVSALNLPSNYPVKTGTLGVPEFGTTFVRGMLLDAKPKLFSDLVRISGFSHGTDVWANNARDLILGGTPIRDAISTRDDIMAYLMLCGLPSQLAFKIMEAVRKGRGVTPDEEKEMVTHGVPAWYIESCQKISYLFPKAHAVAYVTSAARIAWFKVYQPLAFYASYFSIRGQDGFDASLGAKGDQALNQALYELQAKAKQNTATAKEASQIAHLEVACEAVARGFQFMPVDLYHSSATAYQIIDGKLLPPLSGLPGVGVNAAQNIVNARESGQFTSMEDVRLRAKVNKAVIEVLNQAGCLEGMSETDQLTLF